MNQRKPVVNKKPTRIIIGKSDEQRRNNLLTNASQGLGKVEQKGKHLSYIIGNDDDGYIEYLILNALLTDL